MLLPDRLSLAPTCSPAAPSRCSRPSRDARAGRAARLGGADGLRLRRLLRLRRRDRRRVEAPLRRRAGAPLLLNASGCLDALTAPGDGALARRLRDEDGDAAAARGQRAGPDRRDRRRDAQLDRARQPRPRALPRRDAAAAARSSACRSGSRVGGFAAQRVRRDVRRARGRDDRAEPLLPERRRGARVGRRDRRRLPRSDRACRSTRSSRRRAGTSRELARAVEAAGADGLSLVNTMRGLALDAQRCVRCSAPRTGGLSGPALKPVALAAVHACYRATGLPIVGMGGVPIRARRARALRRRRERGRARHGALLGPVRAGPDPRGVGGRAGNARALVGRAGARDCRTQRALPERKHLDRRVESFEKHPANRGFDPVDRVEQAVRLARS